jgi:hypothetical protein
MAEDKPKSAEIGAIDAEVQRRAQRAYLRLTGGDKCGGCVFYRDSRKTRSDGSRECVRHVGRYIFPVTTCCDDFQTSFWSRLSR